MRLFKLQRNVDVSGVSGVGIVAEGVVFDDGGVALRWLSDTPCTNVYRSLADVRKVHGHDGCTKVVWLCADVKLKTRKKSAKSA